MNTIEKGEAMTENLFEIAAAAKMTGLSAGVLRMWQTRYGWPHSIRRPNGYRVYSLATIQQLKRVAEMLREGWGIRDMIKNGQITLPESKKSETELSSLRAQIALLRNCLMRRPDEYWTEEAAMERQHALERATGGKEWIERLERLMAQNERLLGQIAAGNRPAMEAFVDCGMIEYLKQRHAYKNGDALADVIKALSAAFSVDLLQLQKERNEARCEVQDLYIRQAELSRRLDGSLKANQRLMEREMPALVKRAQRAEKRLEQIQSET